MGFYSFYKILKDIVRTIFGKHILKIFLIFIFIFLAYICFSSKVNAQSIYTVDDSIFTDNDIARARSIVGDTIWNDSNYDILLGYKGIWGLLNNSDWNYAKSVIYYNTSNLSDNSYWFMNTVSNNSIYGWNYTDIVFSLGNYVANTSTLIQHSLYATSADNTSSTLHFQNQLRNHNNTTLLLKPIRLSYNMYDNNNNLIVAKNTDTLPYIDTPYTNIQYWNFDTFNINMGTYEKQNGYRYFLYYTYNGLNYQQEVTDYFSSSTMLSIPRNEMCPGIVIRNGAEIRFGFASYHVENDTPTTFNFFEESDNIYTFILTDEQEQQIYQDRQNTNITNINIDTTNIDNNLTNINSSINNSNIDNITNDTLPSDNTQDITADGVNGIFTSIYNAFCTGTPQDIVFPIPFTNKNITLSSNYVSNMLNTSNASFVITLIQAFWWYLISRFIIKDVMNKINKIKSGNIEDIETTNIRGDML